jgi:hypothetical protein
MVNAGVVNGKNRYFPPPAFCESFLAFGCIPPFQNPVKYMGKPRINQPERCRRLFFRRNINALFGLTHRQGAFIYHHS